MYLANRINTLIKKLHVSIGIIFFAIIFCSIVFLSPEDLFRPRILKSVLKKKVITFVTRNNAHCYYIYREQPMGFEYDLANNFASYLGVKLNIIVAGNWNDMMSYIENNQAQVIAANISITPKRENQVLFSNGYLTIRQSIIVNRSNHEIKKISDLSGKDIYVKKGSYSQERLEELNKKGISFHVKTVEDLSDLDLIRKVADNEIKIMVTDSNIALLNRKYYPKIKVACFLKGRKFLAWAVRKDAAPFISKINDFFHKIKKTGGFSEIYNRYYSDTNFFNYVDIRMFHRRLASRLPLFGKTIQAAAKKNGFDWRLIAAQVYQESHFKKWAKSHAGAYGLMQLTRSTAKSHGVHKIYDPAQNIKAGVFHLKKLYDLFDEAQGADRLFISLGAYNVGQGHIRDAQRLAERKGLNPNKWSSLSEVLPLLEKRKYYQKTKYGYCRGIEPVQYVRQIMIYYDILKNQSIDFNLNPPSLPGPFSS